MQPLTPDSLQHCAEGTPPALGVEFGPIPFGQFVKQLGNRLAKWNTMHPTLQRTQYPFIYKYLVAHGTQEASDEQWSTFSSQVTRLLQLAEAPLDHGARAAYQINQVAKRKLYLEESLGFSPLLLRGPEEEEAVVSTQTFDSRCGADAKAYRLGASTFSDIETIDLTDCSVPAFSAIVAFLSGKDITAQLTAESIENVFAKAHLWNALALQMAVVKGCERLLNNLLVQDDKELARQFVEEVLGPIALLDNDSQLMMVPLLGKYYEQILGPLNSSNFAKYADLALKYQAHGTMEGVCGYIANTVNVEPDGSAPKKMFSMLRELAVVQERYPDRDLEFPSWFMDNVLSNIRRVIKDKRLYLFEPIIEEPAEYPFQFGYVVGRGQPPHASDIPRHMRNQFVEILTREGISSLIRVVRLKPLDDAPSTRAVLGALLRRELASARNTQRGPKEFRIVISSHLSAPNIVDHYTELCKPLATTYAPLDVYVDCS